MDRNIRLLIAYDGTEYYGWQRQNDVPTIQGLLEKTLSSLCCLPVQVHGAGRTDTGVHALGMVAHFHTSVSHRLSAFSKGLNSMLPEDIRIIEANEVSSYFHSRFDALAKTYKYNFFTGECMLPTQRLYEAHFPGFFQLTRVNKCIGQLLCTHNFTSFEGTGSRDLSIPGGRGAVRTILHAHCHTKEDEPNHYSFTITGDGFLRHMVRNIVGTLLQVGQGRISENDFISILKACNRQAAGKTAPACGLFLKKIYYDKQEQPFKLKK
jgi:tRNA pseudouridine38-40 synthase